MAGTRENRALWKFFILLASPTGFQRRYRRESLAAAVDLCLADTNLFPKFL
jgi:hypothetical protein